MTVSARIKAASMGEGGKGRIVDKSTGVAPTNGWCVFAENNQIKMLVDYTTTDLVRPSVAVITPGTWYHVVVTWTGSGTATNAKIYVDGGEVSYATSTDGSGTRVSDATANFSIGNDSTEARTFDGSLDSVAVFNRVLTTNEILAIYRSGLPN
jgi:hypothetical protein